MTQYRSIAVTGAAGFIGSNFVRYIRQNYPDYRVVGIDNFGVGSSRANLPPVDGRFSLVEADIVDLAAMRRVFQEEADAQVPC